MDRAAIILAGGNSQRFGSDKGLVKLSGKPLILYVLEGVQDIVNEVVVCVRSKNQLISYSQILSDKFKIFMDPEGLPACPLTGAVTGLMNVDSEYVTILPCDTPFISRKVIDLLFDVAVDVDAAIPRWPNDYIEPLQAVYRTKPALEASKRALGRGERRMQSMVALLKRVRYLSTIVIQEIDPKMLTFLNINTPLDLRRAEIVIKRMAASK